MGLRLNWLPLKLDPVGYDLCWTNDRYPLTTNLTPVHQKVDLPTEVGLFEILRAKVTQLYRFD